jgi:hypothetical protein
MELLVLYLVIFFKARDKQGAALIVLLYSDVLLLCVAVFSHVVALCCYILTHVALCCCILTRFVLLYSYMLLCVAVF